MSVEAIPMPEVNELKEELIVVRGEIEEVLKEEAELEAQGKFILEVLDIIEERLSKENDLNKLARKDQINLMAHLNLFYSLLDDLYFGDLEEFDDEEFEEEEEK
jgi:hypothetical protein